MQEQEPLAVGIKEAARLLGVSKYTIRAYERCGKIKGVRFGTRVLIPMDEVKRIASGEKQHLN